MHKFTRRARTRWMALLAALVSVLAAGLLAAPPANAAGTFTIRGTVVCNSGRAVVGVWLESSGGGAGWASWTPMPGRANVAWYSKSVTYTGTATSVRPVVGCGGTLASWGSSSRPPSVSAAGEFVYNVWCTDPVSGSGTCYSGALPSGKTSNTFGAGYCTWGAAELWRKATGKYPNWNGDAKYWATNAAANGFTVSGVPHARSVAVAPNVTQWGHVMWVTRVWVESGRVRFHVREMNYKGRYVWSERDLDLDSSMRFIVPPAGPAVNN